MKLLNEQNFNESTNVPGLSVVDFFAEWCGPCKMLGPVLEKLSEQYTDINWCKVNVDDSQSLAAKFSVSSIPTVVFLKDGKEVLRSTGFRPASDFEDMINKTKNL